MTQREVEITAKSYVDRVLEKQREMGLDTDVSDEERARAITGATTAFASLTDRNREPVPA
jgi:hypothetical protein